VECHSYLTELYVGDVAFRSAI